MALFRLSRLHLQGQQMSNQWERLAVGRKKKKKEINEIQWNQR